MSHRLRLRLLLVLPPLLVGIIGFSAYWIGWNLWAEYHYRAAHRALEQNRLGPARQHLAACLRVWPHSAEVQFLAARTARRAEAYDDAESHLRACQRLNGVHEAVEFERMLLRAQRGDLQGPERYFLSYLEQEPPESALILEALIRGYLQTYRLGRALDCANRLLRRQPDYVPALLWRAQALDGLQRPREALDDYRRAVRLDPGQHGARLRAAELLFHLGQIEEARQEFERLRSREPGNASASLGLARCLRALDRGEECREILDALLIDAPDSAPVLTERGKLGLAAGQAAAAEDWLRQAVAAAPHDVDANEALYQCLQARGKHEEARQCRRRLDRLESEKRALEELTAGIALAPAEPALRYQAGVLCLRGGREAEGLRLLASVLQIDPRHRGAHQALADYYERTGDSSEARRHRQFLSSDR